MVHTHTHTAGTCITFCKWNSVLLRDHCRVAKSPMVTVQQCDPPIELSGRVAPVHTPKEQDEETVGEAVPSLGDISSRRERRQNFKWDCSTCFPKLTMEPSGMYMLWIMGNAVLFHTVSAFSFIRCPRLDEFPPQSFSRRCWPAHEINYSSELSRRLFGSFDTVWTK